MTTDTGTRVLRELVGKLENMKRLAEKCDALGMAETPQKEWTPYQGKIAAYNYCLTELESAIPVIDAEIAELKRQLMEPNGSVVFDSAATLDAYVQERVASARYDELKTIAFRGFHADKELDAYVDDRMDELRQTGERNAT